MESRRGCNNKKEKLSKIGSKRFTRGGGLCARLRHERRDRVKRSSKSSTARHKLRGARTKGGFMCNAQKGGQGDQEGRMRNKIPHESVLGGRKGSYGPEGGLVWERMRS